MCDHYRYRKQRVLCGRGCERRFDCVAGNGGKDQQSPTKTEVFPKPIIAAVTGDCVAGGVELMLASDIRVAAPQARFGLPEVRLSIYPFGGATVKLVHQIGYVHAMKLILGAELIDAEEARVDPLVNEIVNADQLINWALKWRRRSPPTARNRRTSGETQNQHGNSRTCVNPRGSRPKIGRRRAQRPSFRRRCRRLSRKAKTELRLSGFRH